MSSSLIDPAVVALASGYPYAFPACSYLFRDGAQHPLPAGLPALLADRVPVIACGSNRAPEQLARKFGDWPHPLAIPVLCGRLAGFDVVAVPPDTPFVRRMRAATSLPRAPASVPSGKSHSGRSPASGL